MHDILRVTGFYKKTPLVRFETRSGYAANIRGEKTSGGRCKDDGKGNGEGS